MMRERIVSNKGISLVRDGSDQNSCSVGESSSKEKAQPFNLTKPPLKQMTQQNMRVPEAENQSGSEQFVAKRLLKSKTQFPVKDQVAFQEKSALLRSRNDQERRSTKNFFVTTKEDLVEKLKHLPQQRAILNGSNFMSNKEIIQLRQHTQSSQPFFGKNLVTSFQKFQAAHRSARSESSSSESSDTEENSLAFQQASFLTRNQSSQLINQLSFMQLNSSRMVQ